jgi:hypothetical protein
VDNISLKQIMEDTSETIHVRCTESINLRQVLHKFRTTTTSSAAATAAAAAAAATTTITTTSFHPTAGRAGPEGE